MDINLERRNSILKLRKEGLSYNKIAKQLSCNKSLVAYYCGRCNIDEQNKKLESKLEYEKIVCELIKNLDNINQVCKALNKKATNTNKIAIEKIISKYNIDISHFKIDYSNRRIQKKNDDEVFIENSTYTTSNLKKRLIKSGYKIYECERCHNTMWEGHPIPLQVHHINGNHQDNRLENLQLLCPNCHALTDSYCGKNMNKYKKNVIYSEKECPVCKKKFRTKFQRIYCSSECRNLDINKHNRNNIYSIEKIKQIKEDILKYAIEQCNFTYIGRKMGVSDSSIRKWCKKIGIPFHTKELKKYIDNLKNK